MRGKKGEKHRNPSDPPRRRANKQKGYGTYDNDRPPIIGTIGRESGQVRLRMVKHTDGKTLERHMAQFTQTDAVTNTDEWQGYNHRTFACHFERSEKSRFAQRDFSQNRSK